MTTLPGAGSAHGDAHRSIAHGLGGMCPSALHAVLLPWLVVGLAACGGERSEVTDIGEDVEAVELVVSQASDAVSESGGGASFSLRLTGPPTAEVRVRMTSSNPAEGVTEPEVLLFPTDDDGSWHVVDVVGVDDDERDGDQPFTIAFTIETEDPVLASTTLSPLSFVNRDDEICGNGIVNATEECDPGYVTTEACPYGEQACKVCRDCRWADGFAEWCGDRVVNGPEECDVGLSPLTCTADCTPKPFEPLCGNGVYDPGELCEPGDVVACPASGDGSTVAACSANCAVFADCSPSPIVDLTASPDVVCGLRADGTMTCWGYNELARAVPFAGTYLDISDACAVTDAGAVVCREGWQDAPAGQYVSVASTLKLSCGLLSTGDPQCWQKTSSSSYGWEPPTDVQFTQLALGKSIFGYAACGIVAGGSAPAGSIGCWGTYWDEPGDWKQVALGEEFVWGLRQDGAIVGTGDSPDRPEGTFVSIDAEGWFAAAAREDGSVALCDGHGCAEVPDAGVVSVVVGSGFFCGLSQDGQVRCHGAADHGVTSPREGTYMHVALMDEGGYGLTVQGDIEAWNRPEPPIRPAADHHFVALGASESEVCGLQEDGALVCTASVPEDLAALRFLSLAAWKRGICGIDTLQRIVCWEFGDAPYFQGSTSYASVDRKLGPNLGALCGVRTDGEVDCWGIRGAEHYGGEGLPRVERVAVTQAGACGITTEGSVACWGEVSPYRGDETFVDLEADEGGRFCGVTRSGRLLCWGTNVFPMLPVPDVPPDGGRFVRVIAGSRDTWCASSEFGHLSCFGLSLAKLP